DHVDVGIVRLSGPDWESVPLSAFVTWEELDLSFAMAERDAYALVGYPITKQRKARKGNEVTSRAYQMAGLEGGESVYSALWIDPTINLVIGFDKRAMFGPEGMVTAPDMYGISGAGLWRFGRRLRAAYREPLLSAIATEWHRFGPYKHILATRIRPILTG